jgi:ATP-binding protein involved in chromosome partitioning
MPTNEEVLQALSAIIDPDFNQDIVSLGFVQEMSIENGHVAFNIELTTPACPVKDQFKRAAESAVSALEGVTSVAVTMTARGQNASRGGSKESGLDKVGAIVAISSCKGGVGKSTVAAMLAKEVASRGHRVGLLDADIYGPSVPTLFSLQDEDLKGTENEMILPVEVDGLKVISFGFALKDAPAVMRGAMVTQLVQQLLHQADWGELDYLFLDLPPGTGDIQLTITQSIQLDGAVIVTIPHQLSLADVGKGIRMFDKVNVPVLGIIENMAYFSCTGCGEKHYVFGESGSRALQQRFGIEPLADIPISPLMSGPLAALSASDIPGPVADAVIMALGKTKAGNLGRPRIDFNAKHIVLTWADGKISRVDNHALRLHCGCANCVDEMTNERKISATDISDKICAMEVKTIGNYAVQIKWSDGHDTGLYPFNMIRSLGVEDPEVANVDG